MRWILALLMLVLMETPAWGSPLGVELQTGDVILLSLDCYECRMIEDETQTRFSHSGLVIVDSREQVFVAEALGDVHHVPLADFIARSSPGRPPVVMRLRELQSLQPTPSELKRRQQDLIRRYVNHFVGLPFDSDYRWNNFTSDGVELLYCSEFIVKLLNEILEKPIQAKPMSFKRNWEYWQKHFPQGVPEGLPGYSPADFYQSPLMIRL